MAGISRRPEPEYNVETDIPSAQKVFAEWPSPVVFSGFEIGQALLFPARSIEQDFSWAPRPSGSGRLSRNYMHMPYDRPTGISRPRCMRCARTRYFSLLPERDGARGRKGQHAVHCFRRRKASLHDSGRSRKARTLEALILLASQPRLLIGQIALERKIEEPLREWRRPARLWREISD